MKHVDFSPKSAMRKIETRKKGRAYKQFKEKSEIKHPKTGFEIKL
jgi:hypothetical protein